jgi:hypothetical protein
MLSEKKPTTIPSGKDSALDAVSLPIQEQSAMRATKGGRSVSGKRNTPAVRKRF